MGGSIYIYSVLGYFHQILCLSDSLWVILAKSSQILLDNLFHSKKVTFSIKFLGKADFPHL